MDGEAMAGEDTAGAILIVTVGVGAGRITVRHSRRAPLSAPRRQRLTIILLRITRLVRCTRHRRRLPAVRRGNAGSKPTRAATAITGRAEPRTRSLIKRADAKSALSYFCAMRARR